jgi:hypothetical protein
LAVALLIIALLGLSHPHPQEQDRPWIRRTGHPWTARHVLGCAKDIAALGSSRGSGRSSWWERGEMVGDGARGHPSSARLCSL